MSATIPPEAVRAYRTHKSGAKGRGIPFLFTIEEWWAWWQADKRWSNRGSGRWKFCMARVGDEGPYAPGNVYCATGRQNSEHAAAFLRDRAFAESVRRGAVGVLPAGARGTGRLLSGQQLRAARLAAGLTQAALAKAAGVPTTTVSGYEDTPGIVLRATVGRMRRLQLALEEAGVTFGDGDRPSVAIEAGRLGR